MNPEVGTAIDCPNCHGKGKLGLKKCRVCEGTGRVEYQERHDMLHPPAGSWMPTGQRGKTNYLMVVWNPKPQSRTRGDHE